MRTKIAAALVFAAVAAAGCDVELGAAQVVDREQRTFDVSGPVDLTVKTFDGAITVRSWDKPQVLVEIEKRAVSSESAKRIQVRATQTGGRIEIDVSQPDHSFAVNESRSAELTVSVPRTTTLHANSGDGSVRVEGLTGSVDLHSGDGAVSGRDLVGDLTVDTGDGSVTFDGINGRVNLKTGDGNIAVSGKLTGLALKTGDGSMRVRAAAGSEASNDWEISSGDGGVTIELPDGFAADVDAHTHDGAITVEGLPLPSPTGEDRTELRGRLGAGGRTLHIRTGDGGITLRRG